MHEYGLRARRQTRRPRTTTPLPGVLLGVQNVLARQFQAVAAALVGDKQTAVVLLIQVQELHSQFDDEPGRMTTWANLGYLAGRLDLLREANTYFGPNQLHQAEITPICLSHLKTYPLPVAN
jgi:hypothetical protein